MLAQNVVAPKPALPPAAQPPALPANTAGGPSFAQFLTDQAGPPTPPADAAPDAGQPDEAAKAAQPTPSATRRAAAQPAKPAAPRAADAAPKVDAKTAPTEDKLAADAVTASADEDDAPETPELKEFTQLIGMANAQPDAAAAAASARPDAHRGRAAATATDDAPQGRAALQAADRGRAGEAPEPAAAKPGELRADKPAARAAAEPLQATARQAGDELPAAAPAPAAPSFAAVLAQALPTPATADTTPATTYAGVQAPLHSNAFAPELGARVSLLAVDGIQQAELQLNPADMGPVSVQITVDGSQAHVSFHALQAETRQALEQSLPDLAAALQGQGLTLSGGGVFQQAQRDADHGEDRSDAGRSSGPSRGGNERVAGTAGVTSAAVRRTVGLLDTFA